MTTQQPAVLDEHTRKMNEWFDGSFRNHMAQHIEDANENFHAIKEAVEGLADEIGEITGKTDRTLYELLKVMRYMSLGDAYTRGQLDMLIKSYKADHGINHREEMAITITDTTERTTERSSRSVVKRSVADIVDSVDEVVAVDSVDEVNEVPLQLPTQG